MPVQGDATTRNTQQQLPAQAPQQSATPRGTNLRNLNIIVSVTSFSHVAQVMHVLCTTFGTRMLQLQFAPTFPRCW